jgi:hypothetical protein
MRTGKLLIPKDFLLENLMIETIWIGMKAECARKSFAWLVCGVVKGRY